MNSGLLRGLRETHSSRPTEALLRLWVENDRGTYSPEMFEAVRSILADRGITPPAQNDPPPFAERAPRREPASIAHNPGAAAWYGWLRVVLWVGAAWGALQLVGSAFLGLWLIDRIRDRRAGGLAYGAWELATDSVLRGHVINAVLAAWLLVGARWGLRLKPRARGVLWTYGWAALLALAVSIVETFYGAFDRTSWSVAFAVWQGAVSVQQGVYPVILVLLLSRPPVRQLFDPWSPGFEVRTPERDLSDVAKEQ
jgi:hypothetical protein